MPGKIWSNEEHEVLIKTISDVAKTNKGSVNVKNVLPLISLDRTEGAINSKIYDLGLLANKKYIVSKKLSVKKMDYLTSLLVKNDISVVEGEYEALEKSERKLYENMNMFSSGRNTRSYNQTVHYTIERKIPLPELIADRGSEVSFKHEGITHSGVPRWKYEAALERSLNS